MDTAFVVILLVVAAAHAVNLFAGQPLIVRKEAEGVTAKRAQGWKLVSRGLYLNAIGALLLLPAAEAFWRERGDTGLGRYELFLSAFLTALGAGLMLWGVSSFAAAASRLREAARLARENAGI